jgi:hypothetical protein
MQGMSSDTFTSFDGTRLSFMCAVMARQRFVYMGSSGVIR